MLGCTSGASWHLGKRAIRDQLTVTNDNEALTTPVLLEPFWSDAYACFFKSSVPIPVTFVKFHTEGMLDRRAQRHVADIRGHNICEQMEWSCLLQAQGLIAQCYSPKAIMLVVWETYIVPPSLSRAIGGVFGSTRQGRCRSRFYLWNRSVLILPPTYLLLCRAGLLS